MSMVQLSEKAEIGIGTVGDIERGKNSSTPKTLDKISKALNLNPEERMELFASIMPEDIALKMIGWKNEDIN